MAMAGAFVLALLVTVFQLVCKLVLVRVPSSRPLLIPHSLRHCLARACGAW